MSLGLDITKAAIDQRFSLVATGLRDSLDAGRRAYLWLNNATIIDPANSDAYLRTTIGYQAGEVTALRACAGDAMTLYNIAHNLANLPVSNDFFFNLQKLWGANF